MVGIQSTHLWESELLTQILISCLTAEIYFCPTITNISKNIKHSCWIQPLVLVAEPSVSHAEASQSDSSVSWICFSNTNCVTIKVTIEVTD